MTCASQGQPRVVACPAHRCIGWRAGQVSPHLHHRGVACGDVQQSRHHTEALLLLLLRAAGAGAGQLAGAPLVLQAWQGVPSRVQLGRRAVGACGSRGSMVLLVTVGGRAAAGARVAAAGSGWPQQLPPPAPPAPGSGCAAKRATSCRSLGMWLWVAAPGGRYRCSTNSVMQLQGGGVGGDGARACWVKDQARRVCRQLTPPARN